jgi:voltage-gated potassium channel
MTQEGDSRRVFLKKFKENVLISLAIVFLISYSIPAFWFIISPNLKSLLETLQWAIWGIFISDFIFELKNSNNRKAYLIRHWLDVLALIFPFFRPLRLMRLISFGSLILEKVSIAKSMTVTFRVIVAATFIAYVAAIQVTLSERAAPGSNIKTVSDGIWWALSTVTTVGSNDHYPVSFVGHAIAITLMVVGISVVGVITANIAAWFVKMNNSTEV